TGEPHRHAGEARSVKTSGREAIERAGLAALGGIVARDGVRVRNVKIGDGEGVGAGAAKPAHMPHVHELRAGRREEHGALFTPAVRAPAKLAVLSEDWAMSSEPGGVATSAREGPGASDLIAAVHCHGPRVGPRAPREHGAPVAKHLTRDLRRQI